MHSAYKKSSGHRRRGGRATRFVQLAERRRALLGREFGGSRATPEPCELGGRRTRRCTGKGSSYNPPCVCACHLSPHTASKLAVPAALGDAGPHPRSASKSSSPSIAGGGEHCRCWPTGKPTWSARTGRAPPSAQAPAFKPSCNTARSASRRPSVSSVRRDDSRHLCAPRGSDATWRSALAAPRPSRCFGTPSEHTSLEMRFIMFSTPACQRSSSWNCSRRLWLGVRAGGPAAAGPLPSAKAAGDQAVSGPALRAERGVRLGDRLGSRRSAGFAPRGDEPAFRPQATDDETPARPEAGQSSRTWSRDCRPCTKLCTRPIARTDFSTWALRSPTWASSRSTRAPTAMAAAFWPGAAPWPDLRPPTKDGEDALAAGRC